MQEDIFDNDVRPLIDIVYSGVVSVDESRHNALRLIVPTVQTVTVFAYGVTSSGKTHTMQGTRAEPGMIPRAVEVRSFLLENWVKQSLATEQLALILGSFPKAIRSTKVPR